MTTITKQNLFVAVDEPQDRARITKRNLFVAVDEPQDRARITKQNLFVVIQALPVRQSRRRRAPIVN